MVSVQNLAPAVAHDSREQMLEASAFVLGRASARVIDAVEAERDWTKVAEIMQQVS